MASELSFVEFIADQMKEAGSITHRKMFGEYALYCDGKVIALICDDRLFIKPTDAGKAFIGEVLEAPAYLGAKLSFLIEDKFEDREWISRLARITADGLPEPKPRKKKMVRSNRKAPLLARKFKVNAFFTPCPVDTDDELFPNGIFVFNITRLTAYIQRNPDEFVLEKIVVDDNYNDFSTIDEGHLDRVDLLKPVVLAEIAPGRFNLIDGHHRMEKAHRMGVRELMAFKLRPDQHIKFMTERKGYIAYIEYWNDKLKRLN